MQGILDYSESIVFLFLILFLNPIHSYANVQCSSFLDEEYVLYEHINEDSYGKTEIFRRNNNIGPQQYGTITFQRWFELTFEFNELDILNEPPTSIVGLTKEGRLYHVVKFKERTIARLLSGEHVFTSFQVSNKGRIMAWDQKGHSHFYSAPLWNTSPLKALKKHWFKMWGFTSVAAAVASNVFMGPIPFPVEFFGFVFNFPMAELIYSGAAGMTSGFSMLSRYEQLNTYPNGFIPVGYESEKDLWILDKDLKEYLEGNLKDFDPPELEQLDPKLAPELTEAIQ